MAGDSAIDRIGHPRTPAACRTAPAHGGAEGRRVTVARYLLAGRPLPRVEDAVRIGELMRRAALARFGWDKDPKTGRGRPLAPPAISGRDTYGRPLQDAEHTHAFWLPEDADCDGAIDHVCVYVAAGLDTRVRDALDRITRLWVRTAGAEDRECAEGGGQREWRVALEGFGSAGEFSAASALFARSRVWNSVTPFLPAGHLKGTVASAETWRLLQQGEVVDGPLAEATGYPREVRRLVLRRGIAEPSSASRIRVDLLPYLEVGGTRRLTLPFHRFRSRGRERATNALGAFLRIRFPEAIVGPVALGYACHFGLGLFAAADTATGAT